MACKHTWETTSAVCRICGPQGSWSDAVSDADASRATRNTITITIPLEDAQSLDRRFAKDERMLLADERRVIEAIRAELRRRA
jgi:hypothetical protein